VKADSFYRDVYSLVRLVPRGRVVSYGQVATALGSIRLARAVGYALHALPHGTGVPWHRVINSRGRISFRGDDLRGAVQEERLLAERVEFGPDSAVDWGRFGWDFLGAASCRKLRRRPKGRRPS